MEGGYDGEGHVEAVEEEEEEGAAVREELVLHDVEDEVGDDEQGRALLEGRALRHLHERLLPTPRAPRRHAPAPRRRSDDEGEGRSSGGCAGLHGMAASWMDCLQAALGGDLGGEAPRGRDGLSQGLHPHVALLRCACGGRRERRADSAKEVGRG